MMVEVGVPEVSANSCGSLAKTRIGSESKVRATAGVIARHASGSLASRCASSCGLRVSIRISSASKARAIVGVTGRRAEANSAL